MGKERKNINPKVVIGALFAFALLLGIGLTWFCNGCPRIGIDDANIFFGYAENIVSGRGITYSNNGVPVEGCTSLLWLFICTLNFLVGFNEFGVFLSALVCLLVTQWIWMRILHRFVRGEHESAYLAVYSGLILSCYGYLTWMGITLMDVTLWGLALACVAHVVFNETCECRKVNVLLASGVFAVIPWVRPEALFVGPVSLALVGGWRIFNRRKIAPVMVWGAVFALSAGALTLFRLWYFGYPFPNTYYAKVSPSICYNLKGGMFYAVLYLSASFPCAMYVGGTIFTMVRLFSEIRKCIRARIFALDPFHVVWTWVVLLCAIPVLTGGDHFAMHRFFQPIYPAMCVLIVAGCSRLHLLDHVSTLVGLKNMKPLWMALICLIVIFSWPAHYSWPFAILERSLLRLEFSIAEREYLNGKKLNGLFAGLEDYPLVGVITAGGISRTYKGRIQDLMGLNDVQIAHFPGLRHGIKNHAAFEPDNFEQMRVDVLMADLVDSAKFLKGLCTRPSFVAKWKCGELSRVDDSSCSIVAMFRKDWLEDFLKRGTCHFKETMYWNGREWTNSR